MEDDEIYNGSSKAVTATAADRPWESNPYYFTSVRILASALGKMLAHCLSGGSIEVMGLLEGRPLAHHTSKPSRKQESGGGCILVTDAFALPVVGTETRVDAQAEGYEYMVQYSILQKKLGKSDLVVGWYHSHPGYGCWLSGIDVANQRLHQKFQEPFVALVIDPYRTANSEGDLDIGAFRTLPETNDEAVSTNQELMHSQAKASGRVPLEKFEDYGAHRKEYYEMDISILQTLMDKRLLDTLQRGSWSSLFITSPTLPLETLNDYLKNVELNLQHFHKSLNIKMKKRRFSSIEPSALTAGEDCESMKEYLSALVDYYQIQERLASFIQKE